MDRVLAPYLLARGLCLQTFHGHVWRRRGRIGRPRPGQVLPLGSLVVLADGPATVSGAYRGTGWFDGLGEDGLVVRLVGQYVQPPEQATGSSGPWYAGRICSVGGVACGPGVVPGDDAPCPRSASATPPTPTWSPSPRTRSAFWPGRDPTTPSPGSCAPARSAPSAATTGGRTRFAAGHGRRRTGTPAAPHGGATKPSASCPTGSPASTGTASATSPLRPPCATGPRKPGNTTEDTTPSPYTSPR